MFTIGKTIFIKLDIHLLPGVKSGI